MHDGLRIEGWIGERRFLLSGVLDLRTVDQAADLLSLLVGSPGDVVLDIADVSLVDSSAVRFLLQFAAVLEEGVVVLAHPGPDVERILRTLGIREDAGAV